MSNVEGGYVTVVNFMPFQIAKLDIEVLMNGREVPFKIDVLLEELAERKIIYSSWHHDLYLPDGTLQLYVKIENENFYRPIFWYEDEVYMPFPLET